MSVTNFPQRLRHISEEVRLVARHMAAAANIGPDVDWSLFVDAAEALLLELDALRSGACKP